MGSSLLRLSIVTGLLLSASTVVAKKEKGPVDEAVEKFRAAHERKKESPPGPIVLSADDCQKFAKELLKAMPSSMLALCTKSAAWRRTPRQCTSRRSRRIPSWRPQ